MPETISAGSHGPIEDSIIEAHGDEIDAYRCQRCGLKVAKDSDGTPFKNRSCDSIVRLNDRQSQLED